MAKGPGIIHKISGKVGDLVYTVVDNDLLEKYSTEEMRTAATRSYGGSTEVFIRPDGTSGDGTTGGEGSGGSSGTPGGEGGEDEDLFG